MSSLCATVFVYGEVLFSECYCSCLKYIVLQHSLSDIATVQFSSVDCNVVHCLIGVKRRWEQRSKVAIARNVQYNVNYGVTV